MASNFEMKTNRKLTGRTIKKADVTGHGIDLVLDDGSVFEYSSSDGGYSCWEFRKNGRSSDGE